jgi:argininosuccinate lyase
VIFRDGQLYFLGALLEIHYAHTLMLARQGIIPAAAARACLNALDRLDRPKLLKATYDGQYEDLFFYVEQELEKLAGAANAGRMHTARSRNDIAITQYRMTVRTEILEIARGINSVRKTLLAKAREHVLTVMPAYTHTQPAQPITFAHYLLAVIELLGRDEQRLHAAYVTVNRSPMGACAISTTGFPIDRAYTADLLGFDGLQLNSYGAIAATDYLTETCSVIAVAMVNLGRVAQDFLLWSTAEFGFLRLSNAWVQISSIMPQKRNPVPLEHIRILASKALAEAQGVLTSLHNTPFGDINDAEDDLQPLVFNATLDAVRALKLMAGVMADCEVNVARMAERANADFLSVTELADTLVRGEDLSFREAHHIVSAGVKALDGKYSAPAMVDAVIAIAGPLKTSREDLLKALDPINFVEIRRIPGGPNPDLVRAAIELGNADIESSAAWIAAKTDALSRYPERIREACQKLTAGSTQ